jgi:hypothetical protein
MAIWGYAGDPSFLRNPRFAKGKGIQVKVDAVARFVHFNQKLDVELFDSLGKRLDRRRQVQMLDIHPMKPGTYYLRFGGKETHRILVE